MNISDKSPLNDLASLLSGLQEQTQSKAVAPAADSAAKPRQEDQVRISDRAKEFQKIHEAVSQAPDVRADKVAGLQEAIKAGTYNVKGQQVADKLISQTTLDTIL